MHFKTSIILSCFCFLSVGCSFVPNELKTAERIMDAYPDSALSILQHLKPEKYKSASNRALYGLLLFQALDKRKLQLKPDSLLEFSLIYYLNHNDKPHLAKCYFYKGRIFKSNSHYEEAIALYFKSLDNCVERKNDLLIGKIYSDLGDICFFQHEYKNARDKYKLAITYFNNTGNKFDICIRLLDIGRTYQAEEKFKTAQRFYSLVLKKSNDSIIIGSAFQEIGSCFYKDKQIDSAKYYLFQSLRFPFCNSADYGIRCFILSDLFYETKQYDLAYQYASEALKYNVNFYTQRECYRILVNVEYLRKDIKEMGKYMTHYQSCTDSIRKVELQTKSTVLEKIHNTTKEANGTKRNMILIVSVLLIILGLSVFMVLYLYKRNKLKKIQLNNFKTQLNNKQEFVSRGLSKKIEEAKAIQADVRKNATSDLREKLDKELYTHALNLDNWDDFNREMNHAFNNIIVRLKAEYPSITRKEKIWCCLNLLDIPHADRMLLLDVTSDSLYKLKQRLAHKLNLKSTKDLDLYLKNMTEIKD